MKMRLVLILSVTILIAGCTTIKTTPTATPEPTKTSPPTLTPTETITPSQTFTPTLTLTPTATNRPTMSVDPYTDYFPLDWPLALFSVDQILKVKECDVDNLVNERYAKTIKFDDLIYEYDLQTPCDWAVLAYKFAVMADDDELPEIALNAFAKALEGNPAFAFSTSPFYQFSFTNIPIVKNPPMFEQAITQVIIEYSWGGIGEPVEYKATIRNANTNPIVSLSNYEPTTIKDEFINTVDTATVQALGVSLTNLLPITEQFTLLPCSDNVPDWTLTITLEDNSTYILKTNHSNVIFIGGPWQINIQDQDYLQFSTEFAISLDALIQETGLPYGQPMAMTCYPEPVLPYAYPSGSE